MTTGGARAPSRLVLDDPDDAHAAALGLASGLAIAHGFANIYAITARGDSATVRRVNRLKGRAADQPGSVTTPPDDVLSPFDLGLLPDGLTAALVADVVEAFSALGPVGFRGPAAAHLPSLLTSREEEVTTTQVIVPGRPCPSATFLTESRAAVGGRPLFITSANRSRHATGAPDAPAHWRLSALREELAAASGLVFLEHADEQAARARFPRHLPVSTTIIGFHRTQVVDGDLCLPLERHGSLGVDDVRAVLAPRGLGLVVSAAAGERLRPRIYPLPAHA